MKVSRARHICFQMVSMIFIYLLGVCSQRAMMLHGVHDVCLFNMCIGKLTAYSKILHRSTKGVSATNSVLNTLPE